MSPTYRRAVNNVAQGPPYDEEGLRELVRRGELVRDDMIWDGRRQRPAGELEFLFPKRRLNERRIGIYGVPGSGKRSFLACCTQFGKVFDDGCRIIPDDDAGSNELERFWRTLIDLGRSDSGRVEQLPETGFSLLHEGIAWEIHARIHRGDFWQPRTEESPNDRLAKGVKAWFDECDAILFLVGCDTEGQNVREVKRFLNLLRKNSPDGNLIEKPVAVVLTKWDLLDDRLDEPEWEERARSTIATHPVFGTISSMLRDFGRRVCIFPVSSFGSHGPDPKRPSDQGPVPVHAVRPFLWIVREIDEMQFERVRTKTEKRFSKSSLSVLKENRSEFEELQTVWGINKGPTGEKIEKTISDLNRQIEQIEEQGTRRNHRNRQQSAILLLLLAAVAVLFGLFLARNSLESQDESRFRTAKGKIILAEKPDDVEIALSEYRTTFFHPTRHLDELERFANDRIREIKFVAARKELKSRLPLEKTFAGTMSLIDGFLAEFTEESYPERKTEISEIKAERNRILEEKQKGISFRPATAYADRIKELDEIIKTLGVNDLRRIHLEKEREKTAGDWDRTEYARFHDATVSIRNDMDLKKAAELGTAYLETGKRRDFLKAPSRSRDEVNRWMSWFDSLREERTLTLHVDSIAIPTSFFQNKTKEGSIVVRLQIGEKSEEIVIPKTDQFREDVSPLKFKVDLKLAVADAKWDEEKKTPIRLNIAEHWSWYGIPRWKNHPCEVSDSAYPFLDFCPQPEGTFEFSEKDAPSIIVATRLDGFRMPKLPDPEPIQ